MLEGETVAETDSTETVFYGLEHPTAQLHVSPVDTQVLAAPHRGVSNEWSVVAVACQTHPLVWPTTLLLRLWCDGHHSSSAFQSIILPRSTTNWHFIQLLDFQMSWGYWLRPRCYQSPISKRGSICESEGVHTVNVQAVCDMDMKCLHSAAKWVCVYESFSDFDANLRFWLCLSSVVLKNALIDTTLLGTV